ncbi:MAG: hypothetical protein CL534_17065 [Ahrensia sp.]|nr:hypothetical protein [Ahrensia sp.]
MTTLTKRIGAIGVAAVCLAAIQARAADLDGIFIDDANFIEKPAELGSGWYLRGDIYYNVAKNQRQGYFYDEFSGDTVDYTFGDGFGYGVGMGYRFNSWLRMDATVDRPVFSEVTSTASETFRGSRYIDATYIDGGGNQVTNTRLITFTANGTVTASECNAAELAGGCAGVGDIVAPIDGSRVDELGYSVWTAMANAYVDLPTVARFTPYVGGGIGLSRAAAWYKLTVDCVPNGAEACGYPAGGTGEILNDQVLVDSTYTRWLPTWSVQTGVSYAVTDNLDLDLGYKYMRIMNVASVLEDAGFTMEKKDLDLHQVRVGLRYSIW